MRLWRLAVLFAAGLLAGCDSGGGQPSAAATAPDKLPPVGEPVRVELLPATASTLDAAIKQRKGKVVYLDFWATWCGPCVRTFPHTVELHETYAGEGLACISVSLDRPDKADRALEFLKEQRAAMTNYHFTAWQTEEGGQYLRTRFRYKGYIPHMVVIGRDGDIVWAGSGGDNPPLPIDEMIRRELAKK